MSRDIQTYHVQCTEQNRKFVEEYQNDTNILCGLVVEMIETNPQTLLSPIFRQLLLDRAKLVKKKHGKLVRKLFVDNPGGKDLEILDE